MTPIKIIGTDLETTGLCEPEHRIIECCVEEYLYDGASLMHTGGKTWRIDPKRSIDTKAFEVHKISTNDLIGCPTFEDVGQEISDRLDWADIIVGHNLIGFDGAFLVQELMRIKATIFDAEPFDTMLSGRWASPMGEVPNLGMLCFASGVAYNPAEAHAAQYDVLRMMECFEYGLKRGVFQLPDKFANQLLDAAA